MKIKSYLTLIAASLLSITANASNTQEQETIFLNALANTIQTLNQHPNAVWPHFSLTSDALAIYFKNSHHLYATHFTPHTPNWQAMTVSGQPFYLSSQQGIDVAQYRFKSNGVGYNYIDNQNAFITSQNLSSWGGDFNDDTAHRVLMWLLVTPKFILDEYRTSPAAKQVIDQSLLNGEPVYKAFHDKQNLHLAFLETMALKQYLTQANDETLKDYIAIHHYRLSQLDADSLSYEKEQAWMAAAEYVSWKTFHVELNQHDAASSILADAPRTTLGADLLLMSTSPVGKVIPNLTRTTVILSPEGLYIVNNPYAAVPTYALMKEQSDYNQNDFNVLWQQLTGSPTPSDKGLQLLTPELYSVIHNLNIISYDYNSFNEFDLWQIEDMPRSAGWVGPALGFILDSIDPQGLWKQTIHNSAASMIDLLEQKFPMSENEINQRLQKAEQNPAYNFQAISTTIDNTLDAYQGTLAAQEAAYAAIPGVEMTVELNGHSFKEKTKCKKGGCSTYNIDNVTGIQTFDSLTVRAPKHNWTGSVLLTLHQPLYYVTWQRKGINQQQRTYRFKASPAAYIHISGNTYFYGAISDLIKQYQGKQIVFDSLNLYKTSTTDSSARTAEFSDYNKKGIITVNQEGGLKITITKDPAELAATDADIADDSSEDPSDSTSISSTNMSVKPTAHMATSSFALLHHLDFSSIK